MSQRGKNRFGIDCPAGNIEELLNLLWDEDNDEFVYRGQIADYGTLIPSGIRGALIPGDAPEPFGLIDAAVWHAGLTERQRHQADFMQHLIKEFGLGLGNVIAQQYGVRSEALDVTTHPDIAGFFATRRFPHYRVANELSGLGVIYRFPIGGWIWHDESDQATPEFVDQQMRWRFLWRTDIPTVFGSFVWKHQLDQDELAYLEEKIFNKYGKATVYLRSTRFGATHPWLGEVLRKTFERKGMKFVVTEERLRNTRFGRQVGGMIRPQFITKCHICDHVKLDRSAGWPIASPGIAVGLETVAVEDLAKFPKVERFYFRHTGMSVDYDPAELWPSASEDLLLLSLSRIAWEGAGDYLKQNKVNVLDWDKGILDPGYLPSAPDPTSAAT